MRHCDNLVTQPGCHPAFAHGQLGEAPVDHRDPWNGITRVKRINECSVVQTIAYLLNTA